MPEAADAGMNTHLSPPAPPAPPLSCSLPWVPHGSPGLRGREVSGVRGSDGCVRGSEDSGDTMGTEFSPVI